MNRIITRTEAVESLIKEILKSNKLDRVVKGIDIAEEAINALYDNNTPPSEGFDLELVRQSIISEYLFSGSLDTVIMGLNFINNAYTLYENHIDSDTIENSIEQTCDTCIELIEDLKYSYEIARDFEANLKKSLEELADLKVYLKTL